VSTGSRRRNSCEQTRWVVGHHCRFVFRKGRRAGNASGQNNASSIERSICDPHHRVSQPSACNTPTHTEAKHTATTYAPTRLQLLPPLTRDTTSAPRRSDGKRLEREGFETTESEARTALANATAREHDEWMTATHDAMATRRSGDAYALGKTQHGRKP
jgi:hypothetical protein